MFHLTKTTPYSNVEIFYEQNYEPSDEEIIESLRENITLTPEMLSNYQIYSEEIRNVMINGFRCTPKTDDFTLRVKSML
jgi:type II secretory pathway component PulC